MGTCSRLKEKEGANTMKIYSEISLENFEAWSGAVDTLNRVIDEGKTAELEAILEDLYPDGMDETQLNDILWFEEDWVFEVLGIRTESQIREELEEAQEELEELVENYRDDCDDEDLTDEEKAEIWEENYKDDAKELEEKIAELEEELDNI